MIFSTFSLPFQIPTRIPAPSPSPSPPIASIRFRPLSRSRPISRVRVRSRASGEEEEEEEEMRVHPAPGGIALRYDVNRILLATSQARQKRLRRVPHVFSKVLELPLASDADVDVREDDAGFHFTAAVDAVIPGVCALAVDVYPGVTKVVIGDSSSDPRIYVDDLEIDRWRFRLPDHTRPDLSTASYVGGELVVVVPKGWED